jgi:alpha-galactosidase
MFTDKARGKIIVYLFRNTYDVAELSLLIRIPFIDLKANYIEVNSRKHYSGSELANCGIALENPIGDHLALRLDFEKC